MKLSLYLNFVPKKIQLLALVLVGFCPLIGLLFGNMTARQGASLRIMSFYGIRGLMVGLVVGILLGGWFLCLYLNTIPTKIRLLASALVGFCPMVGLAVGYATARPGAASRIMSLYGTIGLVVGIVLGSWLLCLYFNVVPKKIQLLASVLVGFCPMVGLAVGYTTAHRGAALRTMSHYGSAGLVVGILLGGWILCLGFVYADAWRRGMRPILWVLVTALFPHALGFLLYFVMRQPIAATCTDCGLPLSNHPRFCSWCGASLAPPNATTDHSPQARLAPE